MPYRQNNQHDAQSAPAQTSVQAPTTTRTSTPAAQLPQVSERGLSTQEVAERVARGETNAIKTSTSRSLGQIIRANVFTLFNALIFAAMLMVLVTGSWRDAVFGLIIVVNTGIGVVTELKAKRTLDALAILVASESMVRRNGENVPVAHRDIVLGDALWLRAGEQVPADGQILQAWGLEVDESMLTGESRTVVKREADQVLSGSVVVSGVALARVQAVGEHSYAATLTARAKVYKKTVSDLNQGINTILKYLTFLVVPLCALLIWSQMRTVGGFAQAIATGEWRHAVVAAVAGVVGMIPEGLVLLTSLNFAIAAMRLAREHTLVQELESVETLARVDCLNLDKTGTITNGAIVMQRLAWLEASSAGDNASSNGSDEREHALARQALYNLADDGSPNATGQAILQRLREQGVHASAVEKRVPFSSARKWSAVSMVSASHKDDDAAVTAVLDIWYMGAPEMLLQQLSTAQAQHEATHGEAVYHASAQQDLAQHEKLLNQVSAFAEQGFRVLLLARASVTSASAAQFMNEEHPMLASSAQPVALVLCSEQIRDDAKATLAWFNEQGVRCRIISGDNPVTVGAIANRVGLTGERAVRVMDARELPQDTAELARVLEDVDVIGRVLPDQKKAIVDALHLQQHTVAMTGDGVNDALAIKEANLGIAMGNAAPATKAVAQIVLVDSQFSHLPDVVARGRQVMANMERVASLFLVKTVYSVLLSVGVVFSSLPFVYLPRHITYIGALTIGIPAFLLALAPNTRRYMPGFLGRVMRFALPRGIAIAAMVFAVAVLMLMSLGFALTNPAQLAVWRSMCALSVFVMGISVLAQVSQPLFQQLPSRALGGKLFIPTWRGWLVLTCALAGALGALLPPVARFFAIDISLAPWWFVLAVVIGSAGMVGAAGALMRRK